MNYRFDTNFFQKQSFNQKSIDRYLRLIADDIRIASQSDEPRVIFEFSYAALVKVGICLIAFYGQRIKSREGHHIKIIEVIAMALGNPEIELLGNKMRQKKIWPI